MPITAFTPPGSLTDLTDRGRRAWSRDLAAELDREVIGNPKVPNDSPRGQFFNPLGKIPAADTKTKTMHWGAFPRKLARMPTPRRWKLGENRDLQEEYCEWAAVRAEERITKAIFTSEVPSYFHTLAADDRGALLRVYQEHVSPDIQLTDLLTTAGFYNERNRWNLEGAMHMVQTNNTLHAAVVLVAQSTIVRQHDTTPLTKANDLIRCGVNADPERNSDPLIVGDVNELARAHASITLADPIGLYIDSLQTDGWTTPDGSDPKGYWTITRGDQDHALRAIYEVPDAKGFTVTDIKINGQPITSPSQIAEFIQVKVIGLAQGLGTNTQTPRGCASDNGGPEAVAGQLEALSQEADIPPVDQLISAARLTR